MDVVALAPVVLPHGSTIGDSGRIMCLNSMPPGMMRAQRKFSKPSIGRVRRLMARWSCSTPLFRYFFWRILIGAPRPALRACSAARFDPLLSIVTVTGSPSRLPRLLHRYSRHAVTAGSACG